MDAPLVATQWKKRCFPIELSSHAVGLSLRCGLSGRDGAEFLLERGLIVTEEAIRTWRRTCGYQAANHRGAEGGCSHAGNRSV
jgi:transposase-like protein